MAPLCSNCNRIPAYISPKGKQFKLCAICGWERLKILLNLKEEPLHEQNEKGEWYWVVAESDFVQVLEKDGQFFVKDIATKLTREATHIERILAEKIFERYMEGLDE